MREFQKFSLVSERFFLFLLVLLSESLSLWYTFPIRKLADYFVCLVFLSFNSQEYSAGNVVLREIELDTFAAEEINLRPI